MVSGGTAGSSDHVYFFVDLAAPMLLLQQ
jgi:hypothetical protein